MREIGEGWLSFLMEYKHLFKPEKKENLKIPQEVFVLSRFLRGNNNTGVLLLGAPH